MARYNRAMFLHEHTNWTEFTWDARRIVSLLGEVRFAQGRLLGRLADVGFEVSQEIAVSVCSAEVVSSSGIEGVYLDEALVRSSIARRLGVDQLVIERDTRDVDGAVADAAVYLVDGAVDVTLDAIERYAEPLDADRLFSWHAALFPTGYSGLHKIEVASWRSCPMQVVSGTIGHERIHYEAPSAQDVPALMDDFLRWFNTPTGEDALIKAAIAHLWFLTIHPFEDGNGRIARALTESLLVRSDGGSQRFYSLARYLAAHRGEYYDALECAQKGTPDVTEWVAWFLRAVKESIEESELELAAVIGRSAFWASLHAASLNERQRKVLTMLVGEFEGKLTAQKWAKLCKVSPDTALRDINGLIEQGILARDVAGGRSTSYSLVEF